MFTEKTKYSCRKNIIRILKFIITFFYFVIKNHLHFNYIFFGVYRKAIFINKKKKRL